MTKFKKYFFLSVLILLSTCLLACHAKKKKDDTSVKTVTATLQKPVQQLFYSGTLSPISSIAVESPVAGVVTKVGFIYGEEVQSNQQLFILSSHELAQNYRKAITDYLQKKQAYQTQITNYSGEGALYKFGVISKSEYQSSQAQFQNAELAYMESRFSLEKILRVVGVSPKEIEALTLADMVQLGKLLQQHFKDVSVIAPSSGVALYPQNSSSASDSQSDGILTVGSTIKQGQLLISIGDLSGLSATFNVSEVDVNRLKKGMHVIVTGSAFPGLTLHGEISAVSAEANKNENGNGISMFTVNIVIPQISPAAMAVIRVGMTAKFEIDIQGAPQILLPIAAVSQYNGMNVVQVQFPNGKITRVPVVTGETTPTEIAIISGVKAGDKVVIPNSAV